MTEKYIQSYVICSFHNHYLGVSFPLIFYYSLFLSPSITHISISLFGSLTQSYKLYLYVLNNVRHLHSEWVLSKRGFALKTTHAINAILSSSPVSIPDDESRLKTIVSTWIADWSILTLAGAVILICIVERKKYRILTRELIWGEKGHLWGGGGFKRR